ncbi:25083_t:CDS:2, partial [Racocetra persica]
MDDKLKQVIEVVRYITDNPNYIVEGCWFCQHWKCKHRLQCSNVEECKNNCPHEPQCQSEMQCLSKWTCKHEPECNNRAQCQKRWICRHNPVCQSKWHCRKNWRCLHQIRCRDLWECKYRWAEEYEPYCQGEWQCYHIKKCQTKLECQKRPPHERWKCPHNPECYNKWKCQNKWQCQHKEECDMSNPNLKWRCQAKCQHKCKTEKKCKEKSQAISQQLEHQYKDEWKCRHQCENLMECSRKWECPHESRYISINKCKDQWKCRTRLWHCQHTPPCISQCQEKWDGENEWNCKHDVECQSNWQCLSDPEYRNKWQCQNKLTLSYNQDELKACLKKVHQPNQLYSLFTQQCNECGKKSLISSFLLYTRPQKTLKSEIVCHLVWAKAKGDVFYRVFGRWSCNENEDHVWDSSYTWVSLQKFVDNSLTGYQAQNFSTNIQRVNFRKTQTATKKYNFQNAQNGLRRNDYAMIKCHLCWKSASIVSWKRIVGSKDAPLHDRELCEKCRSGNVCVQKDSYF